MSEQQRTKKRKIETGCLTYLTTEGLTCWEEATLPSSSLGFVSFVSKNNVNKLQGSHVSLSRFSRGSFFLVKWEFRGVGFLWREENRRARRKTLGARREPTTKLNPHMTPGRNQTQATLVGGERKRSHHWAIAALLQTDIRKIINGLQLLFIIQFAGADEKIQTAFFLLNTISSV